MDMGCSTKHGPCHAGSGIVFNPHSARRLPQRRAWPTPLVMFDHPLTFIPLCMERVWGGHRITAELGRCAANPKPIGESWELVDRSEAQSVVARGPHAGRTLHELWSSHRTEIFGSDAPNSERFPLLVKILDAEQTLSLQVH